MGELQQGNIKDVETKPLGGAYLGMSEIPEQRLLAFCIRLSPRSIQVGSQFWRLRRCWARQIHGLSVRLVEQTAMTLSNTRSDLLCMAEGLLV